MRVFIFHADAQGDLLRGLQVVETATNIPTALLGDTIEGLSKYRLPRAAK